MADPDVYLLVEGKNDKQVIKNLCIQNRIPVPEIETPGKDEGVEALLAGLRDRLNAETLRTMGIIVDADQALPARWQSLKDRLRKAGYSDCPTDPLQSGWVSVSLNLPRIGVWVMPDNQLPGMLEDFVKRLIPDNDALLPYAENVLNEIERDGRRRYGNNDRPKSLIHTWLAWQKKPGMPMGLAITEHALSHDSPLAQTFVAWLKCLFEIP